MATKNVVKAVECIGVEKRLHPNKHHVYVLKVTWKNGKLAKIHRPYFAFHDFRANLMDVMKNRQDIVIPELAGVKWFERGLLTSKDRKKKSIDEFCQAVLGLPRDIVHSPEVVQFFEMWWATDPDYEPPASPLHTSAANDNGDPPPVAPKRNPSQMSSKSVDVSRQNSNLSATGSVSSTRLSQSQVGDHTSYLRESFASIDSRPVPLVPQFSEDDSVGEENYRAATDYFKQRGDEVDLKKGVIVDVLQKDLSGWWFILVEETNSQGWAPGSLLEPVDPDSKPDQQETTDIKEGTVFMAVTDYIATNEDEVSYKQGQKVEVLDFSMDGWWKVKCHGMTGYTPATNLTPMADKQRTKGKGSHVASGLYQHHSIYKKRDAPPRRMESGLYAHVEKKKKVPTATLR